MVKLEPASDLSIRRAVNIYSVIVFLGFGLLLFWLALGRYEDFIETHEKTARKATEISAYEVSEIIKTKQLTVDIFAEDFHNLIVELLRNPDDEDLHQTLNNRLRKYFPDFFASNIMTSLGEPVIGDFDGDVGDLCLSDLKYFIETGNPSIRVHPNINVHHYDIVSGFNVNEKGQLFFVSFDLSGVANLLKAVQPPGHELLLIFKDEGNDLIEVLPQGGRETLTGRANYRLNGDERIRVLSTKKVEGTRWHVIDMYSSELFSGYLESIVKNYLLIYFVFSIAAIYIRSILVNQDRKRVLSEEKLRRSHKAIVKLNSKLELLSRLDSLTGLYNRRYFDERAEEEWNRSLRSNTVLTCILLDIDYFKQFNDHYGHQAGDDCLKAVSKLMGEVFRRASDIVARYGGEEFVVIMADINAEESMKAVTQFQEALEQLQIPHKASKVADHVTISAGMVTQVPSRDDSIESFILKADKSLYMAKAAGRNQMVVHKQYGA